MYYLKKLLKLRVVFDLLVKFENILLNDVLFCGFDLMNSFVGVLFCFWKDVIGVVVDIE